MALLSRRALINTTSILYLIALTILAAYALHSTRTLTLPIPNILTALTAALPALAGLTLSGAQTLSSALAPKGKHARNRFDAPPPPLSQSKILLSAVAFLLVYETIIGTLAGTRIWPIDGLECNLHSTWQSLFRSKNAARITAIQDAFNCCGFSGVKDMAFPFPDATHGGDACVVRYERTERCLEGWRGEERKVAGMLLAVVVGVVVWELIILLLPSPATSSWLPSTLTLPGDNNARQIEYRDNDADDAEQDVGGEEDSVFGETRRLNDDARLASQVEGGRMHPSALTRNEWRGDD
ncbi:hypothetical protein B0A48_06089 [Cryoendolithus antarcticus]|uniref:Tetraspanin Tsp3 n=1 Tax=Cryoendolithus antarcticus TaxID=1507870 RepID=A0A1V8TD73_9PEZI|nr:hypothetical protein B0A48_06089 [Cryoendolithus antarcticus]